MLKTIVGIDPGRSGAIAVIRTTSQEVPWIPLNYPETEVNDFFTEHVDEHTAIFLERVWAFPGEGVSSAFKFGSNFGLCRGLSMARTKHFYLPTPNDWQKVIGCIVPQKSGWDKKRKKKWNRGFAEKHFENVTNANFDALLIARYGYLLRSNKDELDRLKRNTDLIGEGGKRKTRRRKSKKTKPRTRGGIREVHKVLGKRNRRKK